MKLFYLCVIGCSLTSGNQAFLSGEILLFLAMFSTYLERSIAKTGWPW